MLCASCGRDNPADARFCAACGTAMPLVCPHCGRTLVDDAAFCHGCGARVEQDVDVPSASPAPSATPYVLPATPPSSPSAPLRTSFASGRYQVKTLLCEGGKKRVYLAQDTLLDREVAFALIKTEGLDQTSRTRIQREAQAMSRLGAHPHIVTVFRLGSGAGPAIYGHRAHGRR